MKGEILHVLGIMSETFPVEFTGRSATLLQVYLSFLKSNMRGTRKPDMPVIVGCLKGLSSFLVHFTQPYEAAATTATRSQEIFEYASGMSSILFAGTTGLFWIQHLHWRVLYPPAAAMQWPRTAWQIMPPRKSTIVLHETAHSLCPRLSPSPRHPDLTMCSYVSVLPQICSERH